MMGNFLVQGKKYDVWGKLIVTRLMIYFFMAISLKLGNRFPKNLLATQKFM